MRCTVLTKIIVLTSFVASILGAQTPSICLQQQCYVAMQSGTLTPSSSATLTVQQPVSGGRVLTFIGAVAQCPGQTFTVDQAQNGTAATATPLTPVPLIPFRTDPNGNPARPAAASTASAASAFTNSNVGSGTAISSTLAYPSGYIAPIDLSMRVMSAASNNLSVKVTNTGAGSCTHTIAIYFAEAI